MEENKNNSARGKTIAAFTLLIVVLFVVVKLMFYMIEGVMPNQWAAQVWDDIQTEKGGTSAYDLRMLHEKELTDKDIRAWMASCRQAVEDEAAENVGVFWLYRMESDEYILYLPMQDRELNHVAGDLTATEETDKDGTTVLVLRTRTPEEGEEIVPEEQLYCIKTDSQLWRGIRMKVIVDGRERQVNKLVSQDGKLYSTEEVYIGREAAGGAK